MSTPTAATPLMTEQVTLTTKAVPGYKGTVTLWIAYPFQAANRGTVEDRIASAWGTGGSCTEALQDAARR